MVAGSPPATHARRTIGARETKSPQAALYRTRVQVGRGAVGKAKRNFRIGISGSYGGLNLGDEAILRGIIQQLRAALPVEITVFSRDAEDTRERHAVERVVPVRKLSRDEVLPEVSGSIF